MDTLAALTIAAPALGLPTILVFGSRLDYRHRVVLLAIAGGWLALVASLAAAGFFSARSYGTPMVGVAATVPVQALLLLTGRSPILRALITTIPLTLLVAVHISRLLGMHFLALRAAGRLPPTFAYSAGWGDIIVAAAALLVAFAVHRRSRGWRSLLIAWNCLGVADLVVALVFGAGSAAGSPVRFLYEEPSSKASANRSSRTGIPRFNKASSRSP